MTDRKQEVIKELKHFILYHGTGINREAERTAVELYDRIAPLIRGKFPEEGFRLFFEGNAIVGDLSIQRAIEQAKRLWEGQPPQEGDFILEQDDFSESLEKSIEENAEVWGELSGGTTKLQGGLEGTCPICGSIGRVYRNLPSTGIGYACPACGDKRDRRSGKGRREGLDISGVISWSMGQSKTATDKVYTVGGDEFEMLWWHDRRTLPDRRKTV